ncbi:MAG: polyprenyl synthetase family protein [Ilumatobacteraceae bacterium]
MTQPTVLARAGGLVEPALRKAIASLHPLLRLPSEYHFGWVEPDGTPSSGNAGKGVRSALAVLGAEAAGGEAATAIPGAVALELVHNFSLVHDDIIDDDRTRRHRRTVWDVYGVGDAIIVGDALHTLAFHVLLDDAGPAELAAARRLAAASTAIIGGQAQDTALDRSPEVNLAACVQMEADKTGALLAQSVAIGAVLAGATDAAVAALERYGSELGIAFQAVDDVLGIWGDPGVTGKPVGSDLRQRKKSMPVAVAMEAGGPLAAEIRRAFQGEMTDDVVARLAEQLDGAGARARVYELASSHLAAALDALHGVGLVEAAVDELSELAHFVVERNF